MWRAWNLAIFGIFTLSALFSRPLLAEEPISFACDTFRIEFSPSGAVTKLTDAAGANLLGPVKGAPFALRPAKGEQALDGVALSRNGDTLSVEFAGTPARTARFRVEESGAAITFELLGVDGGDWYSLYFARAPLAVDYRTPDGGGATTVSMTPGSIPLAMPGRSDQLGGKTYKATWERGAKIALVAAPKAELRGALKTVCEKIAPGVMPVSAAGGPWAMDSEKSRGNYIITGSAITAADAPKWIEHLKKFGIDQVDFHQGGAFRQGDFAFQKEAYPNGIADFAAMSKLLRAEGLIAGLHTYAEFLAANSKYVSPVPHPDLDTMAEWTLSEDLSADAKLIDVETSTADVSTVTGFFVRNSLYLRIDDELIKFGQPRKTAPFGFVECQRGACGTTPAEHKAGAKVFQMTHMFGLFAPKVTSDLFLEIARESARAYNEGGFGMIYLDALDGTHAIVDDDELVWFYDTLFVNEIIKNCVEPPLIEYSTMNANIWMCRSRMGAWDSAHRGFRPFFDKHFASNRLSADAAFLPGQIGWLALAPAAGDDMPGFQRKPLFCEDIHYLAAKTLAHGYGYSLLDIPLTGTLPAAERCGAILKRYDTLRRAGTLGDAALEKLRDESLDVTLDGDTLKRARYQRFDVADSQSDFTVENADAAQTPYVRIENRYAAGAYDAPDAVELIALDENAPAQKLTSATFDPPLDLTKNLAMGFWVYGDGKGEKINIRVESPSHLVSGHNDHFLTVDFTGWRYVPFVEADNGVQPPESWPISCGSIYVEYREKVHYKAVSAVHLMVVGDCAGLKFRTLKALSAVPTKLVNPTFRVGERSIRFVGEIASGHYLEYDPLDGGASAKILDPLGNVVSEAAIEGDMFELPAGESSAAFSAEATDDAPIRAKITVRTLGEKIE